MASRAGPRCRCRGSGTAYPRPGCRPARVQPVLRLQRGQAVGLTCAITLRARSAVLPGRQQLATYGRALLVDGARRLLADGATQGNAAGIGALAASHGQAMRIQLHGQLAGHLATEKGLGLGPVEGHAKEGTAGAAAQAGMGHACWSDRTPRHGAGRFYARGTAGESACAGPAACPGIKPDVPAPCARANSCPFLPRHPLRCMLG